MVIRRILKRVFLLGLTICVIVPAKAQEPSETFLTPQHEQDVRRLILNALEKGGDGARTYLKGKNSIFLTLDGVLQQALARNLAIELQKQDRPIADSILIQSKAAFDPLFNVTGSYTHVKTSNREDTILRERGIGFIAGGNTLDPDGNVDQNGAIVGQVPDAPPPTEGGVTVPGTDAFGNLVCVTVNGRLVNPEQCALQTERREAIEFASGRSSADESWDLSLGVAQLFPWGSSLEVQFESTKRHKTFFPLDEFGLSQPLSTNDPISRDTRFPYTSDLFAAFVTPLPFSKDFGPYGSAPNVNVLLAQVGRQQAEWSIKAAINDVLRDADDIYWELVRDQLQLQITEQQRETLQALARSGARLYREQQITAYDKAQIDANLATVENRLEILWNTFFADTNRLVELLDYDNDVMILPSRYTAALSKPVLFDEGQTFATAQRARPELNISRLDLESSDILLKRSRVQTRPDLSFIASVNFGQSDRVLGYNTWDDSVSNTFDFDTRNYFVGLTFRIPLGNRAVRSRLAQAQLQFKQAQDQVQQTENEVIQELNIIIADNYSTQAQIAQTKASLDFAEIAYDKAVQLRTEGLVSEFELLQRLESLLFARALFIDALIDHRKTRAQLLAAEGVLADDYLGKIP